MELIKILNIKYLINNEQTNQTNLPADVGMSDVVACKCAEYSRMAEPVCSRSEQTGTSHLCVLYASATDVKKGDYEQSPYYLSLNGKWKFHWVKNPDLRPKDFYKPSFYTGGWADINVPGNWERQGYGTAIYVNETYEFDDKMFNFKKNPPLVPYKENEVGSYRRTFTVPAGWKNAG